MDYLSKHQDRKLPTLDFKVWVETGEKETAEGCIETIIIRDYVRVLEEIEDESSKAPVRATCLEIWSPSLANKAPQATM